MHPDQVRFGVDWQGDTAILANWLFGCVDLAVGRGDQAFLAGTLTILTRELLALHWLGSAAQGPMEISAYSFSSLQSNINS
jgi:hypothetical protein